MGVRGRDTAAAQSAQRSASPHRRQRLRFILTGSSARKLKRAGANLLGGRAVHTRMYPFLAHELGTDFDLDTVLRHGSLPVVWNADDRAAALRSYVQLYLKGRDQGRSAGAEPGRLRALHAGRRPVSRPDLERGVCRARCRGQPDNPGRLRGYPGGHACGVSSARVRSEAASPGTEAPEAVLDRSRIGTGGGRTLPRSRPAGTGPPYSKAGSPPCSPVIGDYHGAFDEMYYWAPAQARDTEVDFLLLRDGDSIAIEAKASARVHDRHLAGLRAVAPLPGLQSGRNRHLAAARPPGSPAIRPALVTVTQMGSRYRLRRSARRSRRRGSRPRR